VGKEHTMTATTKTLDLGNNESLSSGVFPQRDGTFLAMTFCRSKYFKTRKGAERWHARAAG
jgi:hypothetical protein